MEAVLEGRRASSRGSRLGECVRGGAGCRSFRGRVVAGGRFPGRFVGLVLVLSLGCGFVCCGGRSGWVGCWFGRFGTFLPICLAYRLWSRSQVARWSWFWFYLL